MKQLATPLFTALKIHSGKNPISFHVPGHKYGEIFPDYARGYFTDILKLDATELTGLDDLHSAEGVILEAETLLKDLYHTKKSFFLINGSTVGNLAMILTTLQEDDVVLVQRNSHKSVMNGIKLSKARPVFLNPEYDEAHHMASGVAIETVQDALIQYPDAKALIVTYPNYYGMTYDLKSIIDLAHRYKIPVLVDEAHGVHFIAGDFFPPSAVELGADIVVQSAHKTLPAMTMGSFLHFQSEFVSISNLQFYLQALQSSSPSYAIMSSLDLARSYLGTYDIEDFDYMMLQIKQFHFEIEQQADVRILKGDQFDPLKVTLKAPVGMNGFEFQKKLESVGVFTELADPQHVLLVLPLVKKGMEFPFQKAAECIATAVNQSRNHEKKEKRFSIATKSTSKLALSYREMEKLNTEIISIHDAQGRICAETITPYPPGIPFLLPGEKILQMDIETIVNLKQMGAKIQGGEHLLSEKIKVYKMN